MKEKTSQKLLLKVKQDYNQIANEFSNSRDNLKNEFSVFDKYLTNGLSICDIGCGNGRLYKYLFDFYKDKLFKYTGIDNCENLIQIAIHKYKKSPNAQFITGDMLALPTPDSAFDLIFNIRSFHHLPSKQLRIASLKEHYRILRQHGIIVITVWNLWQFKYLKYILRSCLRFILTLGKYSFNDTFIPWGKKTKRYYHGFLPYELQQIVHECGFKIIDVFGLTHGKITSVMKGFDFVIIAQKDGSN